MMEEQLAKRKGTYESEVGRLCYERYRCAHDARMLQDRIEEIDKRVKELGAALQENEAARNDLKTQQAIDNAKKEHDGPNETEPAQ